MTFVRSTFLNVIAVFIRLLSMLAVNKILAIYVGPSGYAIVGQFQNIINSLSAVITFGFSSGITKYTAEYKNDIRLKRIWHTAFAISFLASLVIASVIYLLNDMLSVYFLKDAKYGSGFIWLSISLFSFAMNVIILAILNGMKDLIRFIEINILNSLVILLLIFLLVKNLGLVGVLIALSVNQIATFLLACWICRKAIWFKWKNFFGETDLASFSDLSHFTFIAIATSVVGPVSSIMIRSLLINDFGSNVAGCWDAVNRISSIFTMILSAPISFYFLPKLSELTDKKKLESEILQGLSFLIPLVLVAAILIFVLRDFVLVTLFSKDFIASREMLPFQLLGDVFRSVAWIFSYYLISKRMTVTFVSVEVFVSILYVLLTNFFLSTFSSNAAVTAYLLSNVMYLILLVPFVLRDLRVRV